MVEDEGRDVEEDAEEDAVPRTYSPCERTHPVSVLTL